MRTNVPYQKLDTSVDLRGVEPLAAVSGDSLVPDISSPQAIARDRFTVEWGMRKSDDALVIHLYPHIVDNNVSPTWDVAYQMDKRLDVAIPAAFNPKNVYAGFEEAMNSFYIIVHHVTAPDLRMLVHHFLKQIEEAAVH